MSAKKAGKVFEPGDLVFAKVRGYPAWPARVSCKADKSGTKYKVFFYGTYETAIVKREDVWKYSPESKAKFGKQKRKGFAEGLLELETNPNICLDEPAPPPPDVAVPDDHDPNESDVFVGDAQTSGEERKTKRRGGERDADSAPSGQKIKGRERRRDAAKDRGTFDSGLFRRNQEQIRTRHQAEKVCRRRHRFHPHPERRERGERRDPGGGGGGGGGGEEEGGPAKDVGQREGHRGRHRDQLGQGQTGQVQLERRRASVGEGDGEKRSQVQAKGRGRRVHSGRDPTEAGKEGGANAGRGRDTEEGKGSRLQEGKGSLAEGGATSDRHRHRHKNGGALQETGHAQVPGTAGGADDPSGRSAHVQKAAGHRDHHSQAEKVHRAAGRAEHSGAGRRVLVHGCQDSPQGRFGVPQGPVVFHGARRLVVLGRVRCATRRISQRHQANGAQPRSPFG